MTYQQIILLALQSRPMYQGTVSSKERARRRAANKVAKKSRKVNRGLPDRRH